MSYLDIYGENTSPTQVSPSQPEPVTQMNSINSMSSLTETSQIPESIFPSMNTIMIILIIFAIIGIIYVAYLFRDVIYGTIEEVLIYFGLMKESEKEIPIIPKEKKVTKKTEKGKYCIVGKNESGGVICVPYTNHRDCKSNDFALEADCVNL